MHTFPRPQQTRLAVDRLAVNESCPECGSPDVKSYPVLSEGGWWHVVKCQDCLASISREPGAPLGSFTPLGSTV